MLRCLDNLPQPFLQASKVITAGYFLYLPHNATVRWSSAPSSSTEEAQPGVYLSGRKEHPGPFHWCSSASKSLCLCLWNWWVDAWYLNCGLSRYIMQICLWCCFPSTDHQKAAVAILRGSQCQINQCKGLDEVLGVFKEIFPYLSICKFKFGFKLVWLSLQNRFFKTILDFVFI